MAEPDAPSAADVSQRLDKWLWFVRVAKTRTLAARLVAEGKIRVNRVRTTKASHTVRPGDVITASVGPSVRILRVVASGLRRGSASEAAMLYEELTPAADMTKPLPQASSATGGLRAEGAGRPTKRDRRLTDRLKGRNP